MIKGAPAKNGGYPRNAVSDELNKNIGKKKTVSCSMCVHYCDDKSCSYNNKVMSELGYDNWKYCLGFSLLEEYENEVTLVQIRKQPLHKNYKSVAERTARDKDKVNKEGNKVDKSKITHAKSMSALSKVMGCNVIHISFGNGAIVGVENGLVCVRFGDEVKKFIYPDAFNNGFLRFDS